ncbi:MAG: hypothetical protein QMB85_03995, partial [Sulfurospirillum sp.]
ITTQLANRFNNSEGRFELFFAALLCGFRFLFLATVFGFIGLSFLGFNALGRIGYLILVFPCMPL